MAVKRCSPLETSLALIRKFIVNGVVIRSGIEERDGRVQEVI